jgi:hypothetical protein
LEQGKIVEKLLYPDSDDPPYLRVRHDKKKANNLKQMQALRRAFTYDIIEDILRDEPVSNDVAHMVVKYLLEERLDMPDDVLVALLHPNMSLCPVYLELVKRGAADTMLSASQFVSRYCAVLDHLQQDPTFRDRLSHQSGMAWYDANEYSGALTFAQPEMDYDTSLIS